MDVMTTIPVDVILIPLKGIVLWNLFLFALRIMHAIAINWATMTFPLLMLINIQIVLTDNIYW